MLRVAPSVICLEPVAVRAQLGLQRGVGQRSMRRPPAQCYCPVSLNVSAFFTDVTPGTAFAITVALSM